METTPGDSVIFEKHYGSTKMNNSIVKDYFVKNKQSGNFEKRVVLSSEKQEAFIVSFNKKNETNSESNNNTDFRIFPNPANNLLNYSFIVEDNGFVGISIFDISGKFVMKLFNGTVMAGNIKREIDLKDFNGNKLKPGIYFVKAIIGNNISSKKLVVQ